MKTFPRSSGLLMHVTALPGGDGIGTMGRSAMALIDFLKDAGMHWWQILPLGPVDAFYSPYKSLSAFAGNPLLIDPEQLYAQGLLTREERESARVEDPYVCQFETVMANRSRLFKKAFSRITPAIREELDAYMQKHAGWLEDYTLLQALKARTGKDWTDFDEPLKQRDPDALKKAVAANRDAMTYYAFLEYLFETQWQAVKAYANQSGIRILGDIPIYLAPESADVWANQAFFDLDAEGRPNTVAGVPPDYFCEDGQLWGNPVYDWDNLKHDGYAWWLRRLARQFELYDAVRIDHFRALSAYWAVPAGDKTARNGTWKKGPGMDFLTRVFDAFESDTPRIVAEDLGVMDDGVIRLLADSGLPGMRVLEFGFIEGGNSHHLPHNYVHNCVAYTGTHDNNTLLGFLWELTPQQRAYTFDYIGHTPQGDDWQQGGPDSRACQDLIRALFKSSANLAIVPVQDLLGYGSDTRMNKPGIAEGNWSFRLSDAAFRQLDAGAIRHLNTLYCR